VKFYATIVFFLFAVATRAANASDTAHDVLAKSLAAMGGEVKLRSIRTISYMAVGERSMVEQSERPTGPYFVDHFHETEVRDITNDRTRIDVTHEGYAADHWWTDEVAVARTLVINGDASATVSAGAFNYAGSYGVDANQDEAAFAPDRLLLTAEAAPDLSLGPDETLHGVLHRILLFHANGWPCKLSIDADTGLPWQITYTRAYPRQTFLNPWGDVTTTITYTGWSLEPFGISYPREWTDERLGLPDRQIFIVSLALNPAVDEAQLTIPPAILAGQPRPGPIDDYPLGTAGDGKPHDLAPGIAEYPGGWNIAFVKQHDGVVMIEAPWSTGYTARALAAARVKYGLPVKAVITTSDSWPHIAGVRQAVAEGIPVYALDLNREILTRLVRAPHTMRPDDLQLHPREPHFVFVSGPTQIGSGDEALTIYPYRTQTAERQMMVYFPAKHLLYTSDLFAPAGGLSDWFTPQYLHEAIGAIERYGLAPVTIFGMHYDATPYKAIEDVVNAWTANRRAS
jgi:hypothetical protein